jgi:hypothetical protein
MRRHASSLAFFICGFLIAATVIQISHAQSKTTHSSSQSGNVVVDSDARFVFVTQGNRLFRVPVYEFRQKEVASVILK